MLNKLKNKKVLILGLGVEGLATYKFLRKLFPKKIIGLADKLQLHQLNTKLGKLIKQDKYVKLHLGSKYLKNISSYNIIIKSPGIPYNQEISKISKQVEITSQTKIFFNNCTANIIGITGTKGKGTTTSLIYHIFKIAKKSVFLAGNIGTPMLPLLSKLKKDDLVILELSSHQLQNLNQSPNTAVYLNFFTEHLDHFSNTKEYARSKSNITKYQSSKNWLVYNVDDPEVQKIAAQSKAKKISYSLKGTETDIYIKNNYIYYQTSPITPITKIPLIGRFNLANVMAAVGISKIYDIDDKTICSAIKIFKNLPHRLELVGNFNGISFYNDSQGTHPRAVIAALKSMPKVSTLICGGYDRGGVSYKQLGKALAKKKNVQTLIFFPTTGQLIWKAVKKNLSNSPNPPKHFFVDNMKDAVKLAYQHTPKNKICLLSPASASFGIFKNYTDRGNQYKKLVRSLAKN